MPAATPAANKQQKEKKIIALKYTDGHPLTRLDLQYDLLHHIFSDPHKVFTNPYPTNPGQTPQPKLTFKDLYLNTILHSPKCSRGPRDKALENQDFGTEFAKMSLLTNVGRINTTMAFFPELRTQLRTYHPVPPLQKTDGNLQDAPRIKNILKDCFLPSEGKGAPSPSPTEILARQNRGQSPPTTVVNLLFAITSPSHSPIVARNHLNAGYNLEWADLFTPVPYSSASRAQAFLWLCYHYLESTTGNPYADEFASNHPGLAPQLVPLTSEAMEAENVDTGEELAWGVQMAEKRREFLAKVKVEKEQEERDKAKVKEQERERLVSGLTGGHPKSTARRTSSAHPHPGGSSRSRKNKHASGSRTERDALSPSAFSLRNRELDGRPLSPYSRSQSGTHDPRRSTTRRSASDSYHLPPPGWPRRTLVDNAFQLALTTDPLADSGEEDEDARCDYIFRLHVVNRLRGRAPTPETDETGLTPSASTPINIMRHSDSQDISASPDTPPDQRRFY
ncbi:hypothetical protein BJ322DRAFT_1058017 [Thelephora terrestris]|uniref:Ino eighty subunit 1 n=1 Tax=Thelephora terrestris TaxID=56493 RepID=A0A9P6HFY0_9AGAM|nr:hypothetical protein BJ322DRAFT_1058017 [Thelephora terrestris]